MDRRLLDRYFNDSCSQYELEKVLNWLKTEEGQRYMEQDMDDRMDHSRTDEGDVSSLDIESEKVFSRIQRNKKGKRKKRPSAWSQVAAAMLLLVVISGLLYWTIIIPGNTKNAKPISVTYATEAGQQKLLTLSDGTVIRLNEESRLTVPQAFGQKKRHVQLTGEAYFEVTHDEHNPFVISAIGSTIEDLGTKFNVKTDSTAGIVEVAVTEGKVSLKEEGEDSQSSAVLTKDHFGVLNLLSDQITIEKGDQRNYLSWISNKLVFDGQPLDQISRQLERLYDVNIRFKTEQLKKINLTASFDKEELQNSLAIIARTLDIRVKIKDKQVIWME